MPFPPFPTIPAPVTWVKGEHVNAAILRSDVLNALQLLTQPPMFAGAQSGVPQAFTATLASPAVFTTSAAIASGQPVVLSGGSLPGGFSAGTVYYVVGASSSGAGAATTFQLASTLGGTGINSSSAGSGTITQVQPIASATWTPINLDTQITDPWNGHLLTANVPYYYAMLPGFYLAEVTAVPSYVGGAGTVSAGIYSQQGTSLPANHGGQRAPNSGTASRYPQVTAAKLLQFSVAGVYGGVGNNYAAAELYQDSGSSVTLLATATRYTQLALTWLVSLTGNPALPVPDNDTWPTAPLLLGRTFVNKNIRDTISFLVYPAVFEASFSGSATLAAQASLPSVGTLLALDATPNADTHSGWNSGTSTYRFPRPGIYYLFGQCSLQSRTTSTAIAAGLTLTSVNYNGGAAFTIWGAPQAAIASGSNVNSAVVRRHVRVAAGDTVSLAGFQADSGANAAAVNNATWKNRLIVAWRAK